MNNGKIRQFLAFSIVGTYLLVFVILFVAILIGWVSSDSNSAKHLFEFFTTAFSGIIGVIIGYYFSKDTSEGSTDNKKCDENIDAHQSRNT